MNFGSTNFDFRLPPLSEPKSWIFLGIVAVLALILIISAPAVILGRLIGLTIGFTIHEWAHAYVAVQLGDNTPRFRGRLTLDPRSHIEPLGIVLALVAGFGWAKPVQVNPNAFYPNQRQGMMIVALAGPVSNFILGAFFGILLRIVEVAVPIGTSGVTDFFLEVFRVTVLFNFVLFLFNLIPLSPLDGWKIMLGLLSPEQSYQMATYEQQSMMVLLGLLMFGIAFPPANIIWQILGPPVDFLTRLFAGF